MSAFNSRCLSVGMGSHEVHRVTSYGGRSQAPSPTCNDIVESVCPCNCSYRMSDFHQPINLLPSRAVFAPQDAHPSHQSTGGNTEGQ